MNNLLTFAPYLALIANLGILIYAVTLSRRFRGLSTLKLDVAEAFERLEALQDRFTRFQRREGMRETRKEKTSQQDALAEAQAILAAAGGVPASGGQPANGGRTDKAALAAQARALRGRH